MVIESRTIVGIATAVAVIGGVVWAAASMLGAPTHSGTVEITQMQERSWAVEVKDLGAESQPGSEKTAAVAY